MKQIKFLAFLLLVMFVSSCEDTYLSPELVSAENGDSFFAGDEELEAAAVNMYNEIQGVNALKITNNNLNHAVQVEFYLTEMRSDNTRTKSSEGEAAQFESFNIESTNGIVDDYYRSYYNIIYSANLVLANLGTASPAAAAKFEAEAKFVRAYAYFNLVRLFGDIPLVEGLISPSDADISYTRVAQATVYNLIVSDLTTAVAGLDDASKNRASKAAAEGLLAKVHLTLGNYTDAQVLLESIMSPARGFALEADFTDVFYNEGNDEVIFAVGYIASDNQNSQNFSAEWLNAVGRTSGVNYVTADARAALDAFGGNRIGYREDSGQAGQFQVVKYLPDGDTDLGIPVTSSDPTSAGNDWIVLRYADVLLMHVEAILGGGTSTSSSNALTSFNLVRNRAGLADDADGEITMQELLDERRVELAFENQRWFDLGRFGVAQDVLSAFSTANGLGFSATDLLLPIPQREINLSNGALTQNPGY